MRLFQQLRHHYNSLNQAQQRSQNQPQRRLHIYRGQLAPGEHPELKECAKETIEFTLQDGQIHQGIKRIPQPMWQMITRFMFNNRR